jgi:hypothetical protein
MTYYEDFLDWCEKRLSSGKKLNRRDNHFYLRLKHGGVKPDVCNICGIGKPLFWENTISWSCRKCKTGGKRAGPGCSSTWFQKKVRD